MKSAGMICITYRHQIGHPIIHCHHT